jgi:hypothetical protein
MDRDALEIISKINFSYHIHYYLFILKYKLYIYSHKTQIVL